MRGAAGIVGERMRRAAITALLMAPALVVAGGAAAKAPPDLVVRGRIEIPTGAHPGYSANDARCAFRTAGVPGTSWTVEGLTPGRLFDLTADAGQWHDDFDVSFYSSRAAAEAPCANLLPPPAERHVNRAGDEHAVVPPNASVAVVTLASGASGAAFTFRQHEPEPVEYPEAPRRPTVIAFLEPNGFSPYHLDFVGSEHPWNRTPDPTDDIDFTADPGAYIAGYPSDRAEAVPLTVPVGNQDITKLRSEVDAAAWASMEAATSTTAPTLYWFPGTKIVGAIEFEDPNAEIETPEEADDYNESHGTKTASVAGGNMHGTCPDCVLVVLSGDMAMAFDWVTAQRWIDVVSGSYQDLFNTSDNLNPDNEWRGRYHPTMSRAAAEGGQAIFYGTGNGALGHAGLAVAPETTYQAKKLGPDWMVRVGMVGNGNDQSLGEGMPVDIVSYGLQYPSAGGPTADGKSRYDGTSNATPVVAGTYATLLRMGRDLVGDGTAGHADGVVARGEKRTCRKPLTSCPLRDGVLTREEAHGVLFGNVLPSSPRAAFTTTFAPQFFQFQPMMLPVQRPAMQGYGIVRGRLNSAAFVAEQQRFLDVLRGARQPFRRPPDEKAWMTVDSKCRQRMWGAWSGGEYRGVDPSFDPAVDAAAMALNTVCSALPQDAFVTAFADPLP